MTEKRFKDNGFDNIKHYTETSMTEKEFEVVDDYLVSYDGDYFDLHKLSNIRSLVNVVNYIINENKNMRLIIKRYNNENNELFDENEQLKSDVQMCREKALYWRNKAEDIFGDMKTNIELKQENEQLKQQIADNGVRIDFLSVENKHMYEVINENEQLKQQKDKWKQQCIHFKEMLDDMDIAYLCDEWIYEELESDVE